ncbi:hypothetical protein [Loktanella salsilacus]|jgi:hypothetical protein|uniref:Uncharacterized protein n=1 Tax=Loktanella salsilacus TaxID=195913 RepID=A0A1I4CPL4_9RHOB|nr:hypothetical protein [Loktanella salsilacus]MBU1837138.1 hypothetical protein [Alphaproteobacteria bacterium]UTH45840.1 hypothetical protein KBK07_07410 [Loktanella salsilacus]SFK82199.1 hypothetical protein SAMN04488004_102247 [Loktanella salsilacus]|tara:strand:- start:180 stop:398 length:219 start_codon:yes stop_codon:yes gene_type:complete
MSYTDDVALDLAKLALDDAARSGDEKIVDQIGEILGASSQTLQESYLMFVRVRRAEARARALLDSRKDKTAE